MNDLKGIIEDCNKSDLISDKVIKKIIEIIGQEEWNDLHDENSDICTTMGELIITLECIPELEKENAELRNNGFTVSAMTEQQLKVAIEKGEQLEKENAELKDDNKVMADNYSKLEQMFYDNLTKAKDILRMIVYWKSDKKELLNFINKAEQFIKEIEK